MATTVGLASAGAERPLLGRDVELSLFSGLLDGVARGAGQMAVIDGEAGIGKSRLLAAVLADADRRGFQVFRGDAAEFDRDRPFAPLAQALTLTAGASDRDRAEVGRLLSGGQAGSRWAAQGSDLGFRIVDGILSLLERLTARGPVVLAVDDVHWADPSTLRALRSIGRRLGPMPLAVLITARPSPRSPSCTGSSRAWWLKVVCG